MSSCVSGFNAAAKCGWCHAVEGEVRVGILAARAQRAIRVSARAQTLSIAFPSMYNAPAGQIYIVDGATYPRHVEVRRRVQVGESPPLMR